MRWRLAACVGLALFFSIGASAQTSVSGQVFLPSGDPPSQQIRFLFTSDDGMINDLRFTDSNGRFILERLDNRRSYTIFVTGDGTNYGDTIYPLPPLSGRMTRVTIDLNPPPRKATAPGGTISAASGYKPLAKTAGFYERAHKQIEKNQMDQAEHSLRKAVESDPKFAAAANDLGVLLMQQKRYPEAEPFLRQAVAADPKFINALLNLGMTLNRLGRYSEAVAPLRETLRLEPRLTLAHIHLGIALVETEHYDEAEHELAPVTKVARENEALVDLYLGQLYARTRQFEKSISAFNAYLEKAPNAANAREVRALISRMQHELTARR
jgi:tetratricopeptide (TPR) repeat protein